MKNLIYLFVLLALTTSACIAHAAGTEIHACDFAVKTRCVSGDARVTLADGVVKRIEVGVYWCGRPHGPTYIRVIDSSRGGDDAQWLEDGGATLIANTSPANPDEPDRIKVTVGKNVCLSTWANRNRSAGAAPERNCRRPSSFRRKKVHAVCGLEIPNAQWSSLALRRGFPARQIGRDLIKNLGR